MIIYQTFMEKEFIKNYFKEHNLQQFVNQPIVQTTSKTIQLYSTISDNGQEKNIFYFMLDDINNIYFCKESDTTCLATPKKLIKHIIYDHKINNFLITVEAEVAEQSEINVSVINFIDPLNPDMQITIIPEESNGTIKDIKINNQSIKIQNSIINEADKKILQIVFNNILLAKFKNNYIEKGNIFLMNALLIANCNSLFNFRFLFSLHNMKLFANSFDQFSFENTDYCILGNNKALDHSLSFVKYNNQLFTFNSAIIMDDADRDEKPGFIELNNNKHLQATNICNLYAVASALVLTELMQKGVNLQEYSKREILNVLILNKMTTLFLPLMMKSINELLDNIVKAPNTYLVTKLYHNLKSFNFHNKHLDSFEISNSPFLIKKNTFINKYKKVTPNYYIAKTGTPIVNQSYSRQLKKITNTSQIITLNPMKTILQQDNIRELTLTDLKKLNIINPNISYYARTVLIEDENNKTRLVLLVESNNNDELRTNKDVYFLSQQDLQKIEKLNIDLNLKNLILKEKQTFDQYLDLNANAELVQYYLTYMKGNKTLDPSHLILTIPLLNELETIFPKIDNQPHL